MGPSPWSRGERARTPARSDCGIVKTERLGGLEVDHELERGGLLDRQVRRLGQGDRPCPIARLPSRSVTGYDGDTILDLEVGPNSCRLGADDAQRRLVCLLRRYLAGDFDRCR